MEAGIRIKQSSMLGSIQQSQTGTGLDVQTAAVDEEEWANRMYIKGAKQRLIDYLNSQEKSPNDEAAVSGRPAAVTRISRMKSKSRMRSELPMTPKIEAKHVDPKTKPTELDQNRRSISFQRFLDGLPHKE